MAGLYLHIPFCKQACHYCDFHFSTVLHQRGEVIQAMQDELALQRDYLQGEELQSIYLGGGTPSLLTETELDAIFDTIYKHYKVSAKPEITLEANPDDLDLYRLNVLRESPVNRLSIGIQSFREQDLKLMNRAHTLEEANACLKLAKEVGFEQLTADLIYGMPQMSDADWVANLDTLLAFQLPHFSAYALTVESRTALHHLVKQGKVVAASDADQKRQFDLLMDIAAAHGYEHYEISNFALPQRRAVHNSNYWRGAAYLGIGPSAHSFDGVSRQWNVANNAKYVKAIKEGEVPFTREVLRLEDQFNERLLTQLRTAEGIDLAALEQDFGQDMLDALQTALQEIDRSWYELHPGQLRLTRAGKHFADRIASDLFILAADDE